ncbi:MAG: ribosomal-protein-alanine acetyltransferase [Alphaproteobacteria bacterium]|nr:MAG: ribosomal-protein-alanine acetyltransferase [Alphaproteobacteria bacterium]
MTVAFEIFGVQAAEMLSQIHGRSFQDQRWSAGEIAALLQGPGVCAMVVSDSGQPTGFLLWRQVCDEVEILTICILPGYRARGMASQLLREFYGKIKGGKRILLEVNENNAAAIILYEKNGFETVGRRKDYYGGQGGRKQDALILCKKIGIERHRVYSHSK